MQRGRELARRSEDVSSRDETDLVETIGTRRRHHSEPMRGALERVLAFDGGRLLDPNRLPAGALLHLGGWAVVRGGAALATRVDVTIDGNLACSAQYGLARPDIEQAEGAPLHCGYRAVLSTRSLEPGEHLLEVLAYDDDDCFERVAARSVSVLQAVDPALFTDATVHPNIVIDRIGRAELGREALPVEGARVGDVLRIEGWAFVPNLNDVRIYVVLGGLPPVRAVSGLPRADVVAALDDSRASIAGWVAYVSADGVRAGATRVTAYVVGAMQGATRAFFAHRELRLEPRERGARLAVALPPLGSLETMGARRSGTSRIVERAAATLAYDEQLILIGWAVDPYAGRAATAVRVVIDEGVLVEEAPCNIEREDVARLTNTGGTPGFAYALEAGRVGPGDHVLAVYPVAADDEAVLAPLTDVRFTVAAPENEAATLLHERSAETERIDSAP